MKLFDAKKIKSIVFVFSLCCLIASGGIHIAAVLGSTIPAAAFVFHLFAILTMGASLLLYFFTYKEIPPQKRAYAFIFYVKQRPWWLILLVIGLILYGPVALASLPSAQGEVSPIRGFSGAWMVFFAGAMLLSYPAVMPAEIKITERPPDSYRVEYASPWSRMMEGPVKILFAWLAFLVIAFALVGAFVEPFIFGLAGFFCVILIANLLSRMWGTRILLSSATVSGGMLTGEVYRLTKLERFQYPLSALKAEFTERYPRGNSVFVLELSDNQGRVHFAQCSTKAWHYDKLKQLYDRILLG